MVIHDRKLNTSEPSVWCPSVSVSAPAPRFKASKKLKWRCSAGSGSWEGRECSGRGMRFKNSCAEATLGLSACSG